MKELQEIVNNQINSMITTGAIEEMIAIQLSGCIKGCIESTMREYSEFGKDIKNKINVSLCNALAHVTLPEYNKFVSDTVIELFGQVLETESKKHLETLLAKSLGSVPESIKASDLLEEVRAFWESDAEEHQQIEVGWDDFDSAIYVRFINPEYSFKSVRISCYNHGEQSDKHYHIGYISEQLNGQISGPAYRSTYASGLTGYLYRLYCAHTVITDFDEVYGENICLESY
ncbi:hypothetical protein [Zooshikella ganghwensis]|uniref:Uncharacterized protein n=1 Tax=Zooshikella ganghwensis TaxID=202772 RepID=A0A4P9VGY1_9GAMM|nr:hypothetical protein [Zooshikella ganghwensis]RDH41624.1 hypothetical protein B9G39_27565 [Zooshikella ganghwensis]